MAASVPLAAATTSTLYGALATSTTLGHVHGVISAAWASWGAMTVTAAVPFVVAGAGVSVLGYAAYRYKWPKRRSAL